MVVEDDMFLGGLKDFHHLQSPTLNPLQPSQQKSYSKQWSMVVIRDPSPTKHDAADDDDDDFSVFPPSNHENLSPSHFDPNPNNPPLSPSSPLSFSPSDFDPPPSPPPPPPPPQSSVSQAPNWWGLALRILRSRIHDFGSYFGYNRGGENRMAFWSLGNVALAIVVVVWWLSVRVRRKRRRRESVGQLLEIIRQKDEKILQLLNQIAQMNELLIARHKVQASKLSAL